MRWVDKEMGGLGMWKAQRTRREGAEDETEKAAKDEDG